jgi:competence protein ComEC
MPLCHWPLVGMAFLAPAFTLGAIALQQQAHLPAWGVLSALLILSLAAVWGLCAHSRAAWPRVLALGWMAFLLGFAWAHQRAEYRLSQGLLAGLDGKTLWIVGHVASLPQQREGGIRFEFEPLPGANPHSLPKTLQVSWYAKPDESIPAIKAGERWAFLLRIRRPYSRANPGLFDQETALFARNIRAVGQVQERTPPRLEGHDGGSAWVHLARFRQAVADRLLTALGESRYAGVMLALSVGEQRAIEEATHAVFRATGTSHLVAISGLHISLVGGFAALLCRLLWRILPRLCLYWPARQAAIVAAIVAATAYALLAGLGIPVQRALLMVWVAGLSGLSKRPFRVMDVLGAALFVVVFVDPWAVISPGFWLSFGAVAFLMGLLSGRLQPWRGISAALRAQWGLSLALIPLLVSFFGVFPLLSPLANALAIPVVTFIVVPLLLVFLLIPWEPLIRIAHDVLALLMVFLETLAQWPWAEYVLPAPAGPWVGLAVLGVIWLGLPAGTPRRLLIGLALIAPLFLQKPPRPPHGGFRVVVLDVGQGLAIHLQTQHQDWVFDAGPRWPSGDAGAFVVAPYLKSQGIRRLSALVISHEDLDHAGGRDSLDRLFNPEVRIGAWPKGGQPCKAGQTQQIDGVLFEWLHPGPLPPEKRIGNEASCVLRISAGLRSLLMTGDAERTAEAQMQALFGERLQSEVVISGHHGSRTSSTPGFVAATKAHAVIHASGFRNPFHHPHPEVLARWAVAGAQNWRTDLQGAIVVDARPERLQITSWRDRIRRYWHSPRPPIP